MNTAVEPIADDRVRITVEVPADEVRHAVEHTLTHLAHDVRAPGFRKGKVPPAVVRQRVGVGVIMDEMLREHLPMWYSRALDQERLEPIDAPEIDVQDTPVEGEPFRFSAVVPVPRPAVFPDELVLEAGRGEPAIDPALVDSELERLRAGAGELAPLEDVPAELGHFAVIDFEASIAGKPIKGGRARDYMVELGTGRLIGDLEDALVGLRAGEEVDVDVVMPQDDARRDIAGKTAIFHVTLRDLKQRILPDLDDEFAASSSEFDTLAELRAEIEARLGREAAEAADGEYRRRVLEALAEAADVEVPAAWVDNRVRERLAGLERQLQGQGVGFERFLQITGQSIDQVAETFRPEAEQIARQELALKAFADREGVQVSDEELEAAIREDSTEQEADEVVAKILSDDSSREAVRADLRLRLALDRAVAQAKPVPLPPPAEAAPPADEPDAADQTSDSTEPSS
jgi:trigger factor